MDATLVFLRTQRICIYKVNRPIKRYNHLSGLSIYRQTPITFLRQPGGSKDLFRNVVASSTHNEGALGTMNILHAIDQNLVRHGRPQGGARGRICAPWILRVVAEKF